MQALTTIAGAIIEWKYHILGTCPTYEANRPEMSAPEAIVCATLPAQCSAPRSHLARPIMSVEGDCWRATYVPICPDFAAVADHSQRSVLRFCCCWSTLSCSAM